MTFFIEFFVIDFKEGLGQMKIIINFAIADRIAEAPVWGCVRRDEINIKKRLSALILDCLKFSQNFLFMSRIEQR